MDNDLSPVCVRVCFSMFLGAVDGSLVPLGRSAVVVFLLVFLEREYYSLG